MNEFEIITKQITHNNNNRIFDQIAMESKLLVIDNNKLNDRIWENVCREVQNLVTYPIVVNITVCLWEEHYHGLEFLRSLYRII